MNSALTMWRKSLTQLIKMEDRKEWDALDVLSKWFIATRSAVGTITLYSGLIGGLPAWQHLFRQVRSLDFLTWAILTLGLFIAHGTNNLINDYTDFVRGIDKDNYFRTQYGVHPLAQGFWDRRTHLIWFAVSGMLATLSGIYALVYTSFAPQVVWFFVFGALILLFYTYPLKYIGIGELSIFIIWGPLMIGGVFYVLTGTWDWMVLLGSLPRARRGRRRQRRRRRLPLEGEGAGSEGAHDAPAVEPREVGVRLAGQAESVGCPRHDLGVVVDQRPAEPLDGGPVGDLREARYGTYHVVNEGVCTYYEFALEAGRLLGLTRDRIDRLIEITHERDIETCRRARATRRCAAFFRSSSVCRPCAIGAPRWRRMWGMGDLSNGVLEYG